MIANGTGIAPFRSFWQQRMFEKKMTKNASLKRNYLGQMYLYFGCRRPEVDEIYFEEIDEMLRNGVIQSYKTAYSRREPKLYVQNLLEKDKEELFRLIYHENAHFYVCGRVIMASAVQKVFEKIVEEKGAKTSIEAQAYLNEMKVC